MPLSKMHKICMNYLNMQRGGHRKEQLKEICIWWGRGSWGYNPEGPFFFHVLELSSKGASGGWLMSPKTCHISLGFRSSSFKACLYCRVKQPWSGDWEASLKPCKVISFIPGSRWLDGQYNAFLTSRWHCCIYCMKCSALADCIMPFKMEEKKKDTHPLVSPSTS